MRLKQSALSTFLLFIFMITCYFPAYILLFVFGISYTAWKPGWTISSTVVSMNSSLNPILFCWRIRDFQLQCWRLLEGCCVLHRSRSKGITFVRTFWPLSDAKSYKHAEQHREHSVTLAPNTKFMKLQPLAQDEISFPLSVW